MKYFSKKVKNLFLASFIIMLVGIIGAIKENMLVLFLLLAVIMFIITVILMIIEVIKNKIPIFTPPEKINMPAPAPAKTATPKDDIITFSTYFIKNNMHKPRKKDGNIIKGDCTLEIDSTNDTFTIIQGEETINNNISSIYYFDIWRFKDEYYYKFVMRSHNEYMFKDIYGEVEEIKNELDYLNIKIEGKI